MMIVQYSPQVSDQTVQYAFQGECVAVTAGGKTAVYDLSGCPEGGFLAEAIPVSGAFPPPFATRINGELHVQLWQPISQYATEAERFPNPFTPEDAEAFPVGEAVTVVWEMPAEQTGTEEQIAGLEEELLTSYLAQAELFERTLVLEEENLLALNALAELYEMVMGG